MIEKRNFRNLFHSNPVRLLNVRRDIAEGSEPGFRFYLMVVISTMIAGMGLITNSTAVVIGAMLVAPLMTPIFGLSLALVRSDAGLLGHAAQAEVVGVVAAVGVGFLLGSVYPGLAPTPEMLARTDPHLFDLLVAVFSGFAGAYALVDEKISPALPGVAIATAIVPPLANAGLCFSVGAYSGGIGSFLLFFSNFLSILLVGAIVFWLFGMTPDYDDLDTRIVLKRFFLPVVSFFLIAVILSQSLYRIGLERQRQNTIRQVLTTEFKKYPSMGYEHAVYKEENDTIYVFAKIHSSRSISPRLVSRIEEKLEDAFDKKTELAVQTTLAQTVNALGSRNQIVDINLDGDFVSSTPDQLVIQTQLADSTIRNYLSNLPGSVLRFVHVLRRNDRLLVVASLNGFFTPERKEIREVEELLRRDLEEQDLDLIVRFDKSTLYDGKGLYRLDISGLTVLTPEQEELAGQVEAFVTEWFDEKGEASVASFSHAFIQDEAHFLVELSSVRILSTNDVLKLEQGAEEATGTPIHFHVLSRPEVLTTSSGTEPYNAFMKRVNEKARTKVHSEIEQIILDSGL